MQPHDPTNIFQMPDLGLGYLAACLQREGHSLALSLNDGKFKTSSAFAEFIRREDFDLVGIKVICDSLLAAEKTIDLIRRSGSNVKVIVGGPQVSGDPYRIFDYLSGADYAFCGEAEIGLVEFVKNLEKGELSENILTNIPNLVWRNGTETEVNRREFADINDLPFPSWELMDPAKFPPLPFNGYSRRFPIAPLILTRGCPFRCTFCGAGAVNGFQIRSRSVDNVLEEIRLLTGQYGVREIQFFDSNCAHPKGPLREICRRIISENIDITWCAPNGIRIDSIDRELVDLMKSSGCFQVNVGIESGSARILKKIKKGISINLVRDRVSLLRQGGIEVNGFFMIGFPGETHQEIMKTISFALELPITAAAFSILNPLPGTEIYDQVYGGKLPKAETINTLNFIDYKNNLSEVPYEKLRNIQRKAFLKFYLRPRALRYFCKNLNNWPKLKYIFLAAWKRLKITW